MGSRPERVTGHTGTEIRPRLLREAAREASAMGESLTERRRVSEEGPLGCKALSDWEENSMDNTHDA